MLLVLIVYFVRFGYAGELQCILAFTVYITQRQFVFALSFPLHYTITLYINYCYVTHTNIAFDVSIDIHVT